MPRQVHMESPGVADHLLGSGNRRIKAPGAGEARAFVATAVGDAGIWVLDLPELPRSDGRKIIIAAQTRRGTVAPLAPDGHPSNVSHAC